MKLKLNFRSTFIFSLFLTLSIFVFSPNNAEAQKPLTTKTNGNELCGGDPSSGGIITAPGITDCEFQPDVQKITFYRIELCTSEPAAPTTTAEVDRSNCSTFYRNEDGSIVTVIKNRGSQIGTATDYSAMPQGTYTHGIVSMGSTIKYKTSITADAAMQDNGGNPGKTCVTKVSSLGTLFGFADGLLSGTNAERFAKGNVDCRSGAVAEEIEVGVNTMTMDGSNNCFHRLNISNPSGVVNAYLVESDYTIVDTVASEGSTVDRIPNNNTGCKANVDNGIKFIVGVMQFSNPIVISSRTAGLQVTFGNSRGIMLDVASLNKFWKFDVAFFDFNIKSKQRRSRGAWN